MNIFLQKIEVFFLILVRLMSFLAVMPVFSSRALPTRIRIAIALVLSIVLYPTVAAPDVATQGAIGYAILCGKEVLVGIVLGFAMEFIFLGVRFAGYLLGYQLGFAIASSLDPLTSQETSLIAQFKWITAMLLFLAIDGHHFFLEAMARSFQLIPLTGAVFRDGLVEQVVRLTSEIFVLGVKLAAPVMVVLILSNIGLGLIARTMPQLNVFIVSFPLTIGIGFLALMLTMPYYGVAMERMLEPARRGMAGLLQLLGK